MVSPTSQQQSLQVGRPSNSLHFIVGEMSGKLDQVLSAVLADRAQVRERFNSHEARLDGLEQWQSRLIGGGALVVFLVSVVEVWRGTGR